ncbi:MAG: hypothetical protein N2558_04645 [Patescibacteria group bacterium]|nr:hypothetical protein [Patescibacteria group bacterium]
MSSSEFEFLPNYLKSCTLQEKDLNTFSLDDFVTYSASKARLVHGTSNYPESYSFSIGKDLLQVDSCNSTGDENCGNCLKFIQRLEQMADSGNLDSLYNYRFQVQDQVDSLKEELSSIRREIRQAKNKKLEIDEKKLKEFEIKLRRMAVLKAVDSKLRYLIRTAEIQIENQVQRQQDSIKTRASEDLFGGNNKINKRRSSQELKRKADDLMGQAASLLDAKKNYLEDLLDRRRREGDRENKSDEISIKQLYEAVAALKWYQEAVCSLLKPEELSEKPEKKGKLGNNFYPAYLAQILSLVLALQIGMANLRSGIFSGNFAYRDFGSRNNVVRESGKFFMDNSGIFSVSNLGKSVSNSQHDQGTPRNLDSQNEGFINPDLNVDTQSTNLIFNESENFHAADLNESENSHVVARTDSNVNLNKSSLFEFIPTEANLILESFSGKRTNIEIRKTEFPEINDDRGRELTKWFANFKENPNAVILTRMIVVKDNKFFEIPVFIGHAGKGYPFDFFRNEFSQGDGRRLKFFYNNKTLLLEPVNNRQFLAASYMEFQQRIVSSATLLDYLNSLDIGLTKEEINSFVSDQMAITPPENLARFLKLNMSDEKKFFIFITCTTDATYDQNLTEWDGVAFYVMSVVNE